MVDEVNMIDTPDNPTDGSEKTNPDGLKQFGLEDKPTKEIAWDLYQRGIDFNNQVDLYDIVKVNQNFYVGKQWEGVQSNGLPTPTFNILKRVVGFITATITSDNVKCSSQILTNTVGTSQIQQIADVVNDEFQALTEQNRIPSLVREMAVNAAVDGDGCIYTYWDPDLETGQKNKGGIKSEVLYNTQVIFGNPNTGNVQEQPYIIISRRILVRDARKKARDNGIDEWNKIISDSDTTNVVDDAKITFDKVTSLLILWRDDHTNTIWGFETTRNCVLKEAWDLGIRLYPLTWISWDNIRDSYHGQAMITGLIPNQIFINKVWAMTMLSVMRLSYPKVVFDKTRVSKWDNRVGGAIGINGGDVNTVAKIMEGASVSPQISQLLELATTQTEQSLGATSVALGDTRPDNTSAIIALQRAASTPSEMTKQRIYAAVEELFRIYLEFMGEYYGKRVVDRPIKKREREAFMFIQQNGPELQRVNPNAQIPEKIPEEVPEEFNFDIIKKHPMTLKLDVGASTYYSEIAAIQTLSNLLQQGSISTKQFLERIPDDYIPKRSALISEIEEQEQQQQMMMQGQQPMPQGAPQGNPIDLQQKQPINGGQGYGGLQRAINKTGDTKGIV